MLSLGPLKASGAANRCTAFRLPRQGAPTAGAAMPTFVDPPPFPVIDPQPTASRVIRAFRLSDWAIAAALTTVGYAWGFSLGRMPWGGLFATTGILGGLQYGYVKTSSRLMGYDRNEQELDKYGYWRPPPPAPAAAAEKLAPVDTKY